MGVSLAREINPRGGELTVDGVVIEGIRNNAPISMGRGAAPDIDTTTIYDTARQNIQDLPDAGVVSFGLLYNPADPTHRKLEQLLDSNDTASFIWSVYGSEDTRGRIGKTGKTVETITAAIADATGVLSVTAGARSNLKIGDYLIEGSNQYIIDGMDSSGSLVVRKPDGSEISAVSSKSYTVKVPAMRKTFEARVVQFPIGGGVPLGGAVTLRVVGVVTDVVGTPDIT